MSSSKDEKSDDSFTASNKKPASKLQSKSKDKKGGKGKQPKKSKDKEKKEPK
jgi:hypothetical protein